MMRRLLQGKITSRALLASVEVRYQLRAYGAPHQQDRDSQRRSLMDTLSERFRRSLEEYRRALQLANKGLEFHSGPWEVARDVPRIIYDSWVQSIPGVWKISYKESEGAILLYGDPSPPHARTAAWFSKEISGQIVALYGWDALNTLDMGTDEDFDIPGYGIKIPDFSVVPATAKGVPPSLVVEVGYRNERSFKVVVGEVSLWEKFGSSIVVGLKITDTLLSASVTDPRIEILLRVQGQDDKMFHLGQGAQVPCVGPGTHIMRLPCALLLPLVEGASHDICLDLFVLQERIRKWVR